MKTSTIVSFSGYARLRSRYQCKCCGRMELGTTFHKDLTHYMLEDVQQLETIVPNGHNMPIGWSSSWDGFTCPTCEKESK